MATNSNDKYASGIWYIETKYFGHPIIVRYCKSWQSITVYYECDLGKSSYSTNGDEITRLSEESFEDIKKRINDSLPDYSDFVKIATDIPTMYLAGANYRLWVDIVCDSDKRPLLTYYHKDGTAFDFNYNNHQLYATFSFDNGYGVEACIGFYADDDFIKFEIPSLTEMVTERPECSETTHVEYHEVIGLCGFHDKDLLAFLEKHFGKDEVTIPALIKNLENALGVRSDLEKKGVTDIAAWVRDNCADCVCPIEVYERVKSWQPKIKVDIVQQALKSSKVCMKLAERGVTADDMELFLLYHCHTCNTIEEIINYLDALSAEEEPSESSPFTKEELRIFKKHCAKPDEDISSRLRNEIVISSSQCNAFVHNSALILLNTEESAIGYCYPRLFFKTQTGYANFDMTMGAAFMMFEKDWKDWCSDCVLITEDKARKHLSDCGYTVPDELYDEIASHWDDDEEGGQ